MPHQFACDECDCMAWWQRDAGPLLGYHGDRPVALLVAARESHENPVRLGAFSVTHCRRRGAKDRVRSKAFELEGCLLWSVPLSESAGDLPKGSGDSP